MKPNPNPNWSEKQNPNPNPNPKKIVRIPNTGPDRPDDKGHLEFFIPEAQEKETDKKGLCHKIESIFLKSL